MGQTQKSECEVRFAPINGHRQLGAPRPKSANSGRKNAVGRYPQTLAASSVSIRLRKRSIGRSHANHYSIRSDRKLFQRDNSDSTNFLSRAGRKGFQAGEKEPSQLGSQLHVTAASGFKSRIVNAQRFSTAGANSNSRARAGSRLFAPSNQRFSVEEDSAPLT